MKEKLQSRKFWVTVAAFLASIGASITGLAINDHTITAIGMVCTVVATAIYAAAEAAVDAANAASNTTATNTTNSVTVTGNTTGAKAMDAINGAAAAKDAQ